jgi:NAD(P)H dehydrogenase (quinone)
LKIAVTAASGRLGHAILGELRSATSVDRVVAIARSPERIGIPGIDKRTGDYGSVQSMTAALAGIDTAILISAPIEKGTDRAQLHRNVIGAARAAGVGTLIYTSVIGIDGEGDTLYAASQRVHCSTEAALRESGLQWVVLRNGLYLELDLQHIIAAEREGVYANPGGAGRTPYMTIDELAFGTARVAISPGRHHGQVYNLTGDCVSQADLVAMANQVFGLHVRYQPISDEAYLAKRTPERGEAVARMLTGCFQCIRVGAFEVPSNFKAAAGRPPKSLRVMLEECRARSARTPAPSPRA